MRKIRFPRRAGIMLSVIALTISGCGDFKETHNPTVSDLSLSPEAMGEVNRISIPMPIPAPVQPPKRAEAASLWGAKTPQLFQDRRAEDVGDLVTVLIDINDRAQLQNATGRSRSSTQGVSDPDILDFNLSTSSGKVLGLESNSSANGEGSIRRNESIRLRVAALIIQTLPNGNFVIAGRQEVKVNAELRELRIAGIIRQSDINVDNTIDYDKIAEARITYGGRGQISTVQTARYGQDILEVILPY
ncbi:MAG: flagellar basal body L-ring protein FlgH [Sulfitobacter sp.]|jgi:flagellar L-ring protein FlgH|uniref:flagellar basal body L-ring protein FlgH n=1 Tax=Sulfitobacter sp. TaxID=1903071 RepID=UPI000C5F6DBE|nr:flagellar basal body L-ring protein [Roseobacter sp.]MBV50425.1 flagellar basal body L-ring protein [Roseobacter sp.]|tara:strand:+ start:2175 stop:2912 length:738 start_codon:yes stop_codon:yes gene_type:complete